MKKTSTILFSLVLLSVLAGVAAHAAAESTEGRWESLGELHVRDRVDRDTLQVGARKVTFDAIRLEVKGRAVQFHDVEIHFENEGGQQVRLRSVIRAGSASRVIDLEGGQRAIDRIVFLYDAQTRRRHKGARVKVLGRH
jgi:hypothetical protein